MALGEEIHVSFSFFDKKKTIPLKNCRFSGGCIGNPDNEEGRCCGGSWIWENGVKTNNGDRGVGDTLVDDQPLKNTKEVLE